MLFLYAAVLCFLRNRWSVGCLLYSLGVSVKMNVLLFAPGLFFLLIQVCSGPRSGPAPGVGEWGLYCIIMDGRHIVLSVGQRGVTGGTISVLRWPLQITDIFWSARVIQGFPQKDLVNQVQILCPKKMAFNFSKRHDAS